MKKVAVLRCLQTSASCAGAGCLRAFNEKTGAFAVYGEQPLQLMAVWTCNGCGNNRLENQEGIEKKIARMQTLEVDVVHLSGCTKKKNAEGERVRCPHITKIAEKLQELGIAIADGTHHS